MAKRAWVVIALLAVSLSWPGKAFCQSPSPEALAAAKELMTSMHVADQIDQMLPLIMQQLKPLVAKGNPAIERDYDALTPTATAAFREHVDKFIAGGAIIYAGRFSAEEIQQINAFMHTPTGQKFLQNQAAVAKDFMLLGQRIGGLVAQDLQVRITNELRKRGHDI